MCSIAIKEHQDLGGCLRRFGAIFVADGINPVKVEEIIRWQLCFRQLIGQID